MHLQQTINHQNSCIFYFHCGGVHDAAHRPAYAAEKLIKSENINTAQKNKHKTHQELRHHANLKQP